jgi:hypothetical protein
MKNKEDMLSVLERSIKLNDTRRKEAKKDEDFKKLVG